MDLGNHAKRKQRKQKGRASLAIFVMFSFICNKLFASDYGTTGLIDIPTARMQFDGKLSATVAFDGRHRQFSMTYQIAPWLEGTFRYSGLDEFDTWDRNYELKARLWEEDLYLPEAAIGIRDVVGTGVFGSEYIVFSKGVGRSDISFGVGWGRLAGDGIVANPMTRISERFSRRNPDFGVGGDISYGDFFSGPNVGFFGGVRYSLKSWPLDLIAEYNPDRYDFDVGRGGEAPSSLLSYGISWRALPGTTLSLSYQNGDEISLATQFSLNTLSDPKRIEKPDFVKVIFSLKANCPLNPQGALVLPSSLRCREKWIAFGGGHTLRGPAASSVSGGKCLSCLVE